MSVFPIKDLISLPWEIFLSILFAIFISLRGLYSKPSSGSGIQDFSLGKLIFIFFVWGKEAQPFGTSTMLDTFLRILWLSILFKSAHSLIARLR